MNLPAVSIVIRSKNDATLIDQTLSSIQSQDYPSPIRKIHIDSGSTDGTCDIIEKYRPDQFLRIRAEDYVPGRVLNTGMKLSSEDWVVFLNSDAAPIGRDWLTNLLKTTLSSQGNTRGIGAVFGRQVPRPDCHAVYAHDYERCFGPQRESKKWGHFFSMVSSAVSRAAWLEQPFREDLQYSEDEEWSRRLKKKGWDVVYVEDSVVMHSHNYTPSQAKRRCYGESFASAAIEESLRPSDYNFLKTVILGGTKEIVKDLIYCAKTRRLHEWPHAIAIRYAQRIGKRKGFLAGCQHYRRAGLQAAEKQ